MDKEHIDRKAAEISEEVIAAYEETGWQPLAGTVGAVDKSRGCAIGVMAFLHNPATFKDRSLDKPYNWFEYCFEVDDEAFAHGFDTGFGRRKNESDTEFGQEDEPEEEDCCERHRTDQMIGFIVGRNVREWWAMKCIRETDERDTRDREALYA